RYARRAPAPYAADGSRPGGFQSAYPTAGHPGLPERRRLDHESAAGAEALQDPDVAAPLIMAWARSIICSSFNWIGMGPPSIPPCSSFFGASNPRMSQRCFTQFKTMPRKRESPACPLVIFLTFSGVLLPP